ncbi:MAG: exodeoxyribonuclease III [Alphaproteobacteria bacterium]|nr:exodeoxyribonuclease III [Alphaproteobacteria bacterium]
MKILTLNINSIRAHAQSFIEILQHGQYDTILVQELKVDNANFPHNLFDDYGYNIKVFGQKTWNGVAVFSKYSIEDVQMGLPNYSDVNARFIECVIDGNIRLINVYMPNGESEDSPKFQYKLEWMEKFGHHIKNYIDSEESVIIGGDFNVAISDIDIWNPHNYIGSSISAPDARKIMQRWLDDGWVDAWRHINPEKTGYTWYGYRGRDTVGNDQGLRLDYFMVNKTAHRNIKNCEIDMKPRMVDKPTDHCGLVLEI